MADKYTLHEGSGVNLESVAGKAAIKVTGEVNANLFKNAVPVVLKKFDDDGKVVAEFAGFKVDGDHKPMTVTHVVIGDKSIKLNEALKVEFIQPRDGKNTFEAFWANITRAPQNPDTGKVTPESTIALDEVHKVHQKAPEAAQADITYSPAIAPEGISPTALAGLTANTVGRSPA